MTGCQERINVKRSKLWIKPNLDIPVEYLNNNITVLHWHMVSSTNVQNNPHHLESFRNFKWHKISFVRDNSPSVHWYAQEIAVLQLDYRSHSDWWWHWLGCPKLTQEIISASKFVHKDSHRYGKLAWSFLDQSDFSNLHNRQIWLV